MDKPLILLTNDDGIASPGLRAAAAAVLDLGDLLIVAPQEQHTGASRYLRGFQREAAQVEYQIDGKALPAYAVAGTPAFAVHCAVMLIAARPPALTISGINYGENIGSDVTISGTIGAALEAACFGIPALALSLETNKEHHLSYSEAVDFRAAAHFTRHFAQQLLQAELAAHIDVLSINVPAGATPQTAWRPTRVSRCRYFHSVLGDDPHTGQRHIRDYESRVDRAAVERDSDIWAMAVDRVVSASPLTIDLTAANWHTVL